MDQKSFLSVGELLDTEKYDEARKIINQELENDSHDLYSLLAKAWSDGLNAKKDEDALEACKNLDKIILKDESSFSSSEEYGTYISDGLMAYARMGQSFYFLFSDQAKGIIEKSLPLLQTSILSLDTKKSMIKINQDAAATPYAIISYIITRMETIAKEVFGDDVNKFSKKSYDRLGQIVSIYTDGIAKTFTDKFSEAGAVTIQLFLDFSKTVIELIEKKEKQLEKEKKEANEKFWNEHPELYKPIKDRIENINLEIRRITEECDNEETENNNKIQELVHKKNGGNLVEEQADLDKLENDKSDLERELASLGFFKKKQKEEIRQKIENKNKEISRLQTTVQELVDIKKQEIQKSIDKLKNNNQDIVERRLKIKDLQQDLKMEEEKLNNPPIGM